MEADLNDVLNECIERLARGERVEECVERYPEQRDELLPLLKVAAATLATASSVAYRPEVKARSLNRLTAALAQRSSRKESRLAWPNWRRRLAMPVAIGLVAATVATGTAFGANAASSSSVPGDPLYRVKTTRESISLMVPQSDVKRARTHIHLARVRGREMSELVHRRRFSEAARLTKRIKYHLKESADMVGVVAPANLIEMPPRPPMLNRDDEANEFRSRLQRDQRFLRASLLELVHTMPPTDQHSVKLLMRRSELGYQMLIAALDDSGGPPRQLFWITVRRTPRNR